MSIPQVHKTSRLGPVTERYAKLPASEVIEIIKERRENNWCTAEDISWLLNRIEELESRHSLMLSLRKRQP